MKYSFENLLPKIVLAPTTVAMVVCMYGFMFWTAGLSMTKSRMLPQWEFAGFSQYERLHYGNVSCRTSRHR